MTPHDHLLVAAASIHEAVAMLQQQVHHSHYSHLFNGQPSRTIAAAQHLGAAKLLAAQAQAIADALADPSTAKCR